VLHTQSSPASRITSLYRGRRNKKKFKGKKAMWKSYVCICIHYPAGFPRPEWPGQQPFCDPAISCDLLRPPAETAVPDSHLFSSPARMSMSVLTTPSCDHAFDGTSTLSRVAKPRRQTDFFKYRQRSTVGGFASVFYRLQKPAGLLCIPRQGPEL
jgi:hypothetical protein